MDDDLWDGGNDDQEMANSGKADGYVDGLELAPILIGDPPTWRILVLLKLAEDD